jgi:hypothetical protein
MEFGKTIVIWEASRRYTTTELLFDFGMFEKESVDHGFANNSRTF